jgi:hypothetical protein
MGGPSWVVLSCMIADKMGGGEALTRAAGFCQRVSRWRREWVVVAVCRVVLGRGRNEGKGRSVFGL